METDFYNRAMADMRAARDLVMKGQPVETVILFHCLSAIVLALFEIAYQIWQPGRGNNEAP